MQSPDIRIDQRQIIMNGKVIAHPLTKDELDDLLAETSRIVDPPIPAPVGYRNPHFLVYDAIGIVGLVSHLTDLVVEMNIAYDCERFVLHAKPTYPFQGSLHIEGHAVDSNLTERALTLNEGIQARRWLNVYICRLASSYIEFNFEGRRKPGRRIQSGSVVSVSFSLPDSDAVS